jgi:hypothetical protein
VNPRGAPAATPRAAWWPRAAAWAKSLLLAHDMTSEWSCCGAARMAEAETTLGEAGPYELWMNSCAHCGGRWMNVHTVPWTIARWKPVTQRDAETLLRARPGVERQAALEQWVRRNLSRG